MPAILLLLQSMPMDIVRVPWRASLEDRQPWPCGDGIRNLVVILAPPPLGLRPASRYRHNAVPIGAVVADRGVGSGRRGGCWLVPPASAPRPKGIPMTTTYLAASVWVAIERAQAEIDRHAASGVDGRCLGCGESEPCPSRAGAHAVLARSNSLPLRRPGLASRGVTRNAGFNWLAGA